MKPVSVRTWKFNLQTSFFGEVFLIARFALVGIVAALVHITAVWVLIEKMATAPILANLLAFLLAFTLAFCGHYIWTFQQPGHPERAILRYFLISGAAFFANTLLLAGLLETSWAEPFVAAIVAAVVIPIITFLASRFWGFHIDKSA